MKEVYIGGAQRISKAVKLYNVMVGTYHYAIIKTHKLYNIRGEL